MYGTTKCPTVCIIAWQGRLFCPPCQLCQEKLGLMRSSYQSWMARCWSWDFKGISEVKMNECLSLLSLSDGILFDHCVVILNHAIEWEQDLSQSSTLLASLSCSGHWPDIHWSDGETGKMLQVFSCHLRARHKTHTLLEKKVQRAFKVCYFQNVVLLPNYAIVDTYSVLRLSLLWCKRALNSLCIWW